MVLVPRLKIFKFNIAQRYEFPTSWAIVDREGKEYSGGKGGDTGFDYAGGKTTSCLQPIIGLVFHCDVAALWPQNVPERFLQGLHTPLHKPA
jgi:hypothetical protein